MLATFLGSDPISVGGTDEQRRLYLSRIAEEAIMMAYGATEPEAGSDLGALKTIAEPVGDDGNVTGYRLTGAKQWISNGGVAELVSVLALAPGGPSWFDADQLVGGVEGHGLVQAQQVFGYTRLMVAAFGLGAGWAGLDRAIPYSRKLIQAGGPLSEKQGYTHKLIVPHAVALEASRAAIEETAARIDAGAGPLNVEGAVAKYLATEADDQAADAAIQAHGGYGYTHDYMVEKIKRDVRITRIYEGTSEIMEMTITRGRWQEHLKTRGDYYHASARELGEDRARDQRRRRPAPGRDAGESRGVRWLARVDARMATGIRRRDRAPWSTSTARSCSALCPVVTVVRLWSSRSASTLGNRLGHRFGDLAIEDAGDDAVGVRFVLGDDAGDGVRSGRLYLLVDRTCGVHARDRHIPDDLIVLHAHKVDRA